MSKKLGLEGKYKGLKPTYLQYPVITSVKPNVTGKMGGGMMRYKTGNAVKLSPKQKAIAAKAPPMNRIDGKDFAVLKAEKAKGRGQGLQDEKMKPGKVTKAALGVLAAGLGARKKMKDKKMAPMAMGAVGAGSMKMDLIKKILGKKTGGVMKVKLNPKTR